MSNRSQTHRNTSQMQKIPSTYWDKCIKLGTEKTTKTVRKYMKFTGQRTMGTMQRSTGDKQRMTGAGSYAKDTRHLTLCNV